MSGKAYICRLKNIQPIEGADKIVQSTMFGETIITSIDNKEGTLGLLFDCDTQLSHEFASNNNLYRHSELNVDKEVKGYFDDNRRVRPIKLKGVKCSAMFIPVDSLAFTGCKIFTESEGSEIDTYCGIPICNKYISKETINMRTQGKAVKKNLVPTFKEHMDTDQLMKNLNKIRTGNLITVTEKLHGTSGRCGYLLTKLPESSKWEKFVGIISSLLTGFSYKEAVELENEDCFGYEFVTGSRRVVKSIGGEDTGKEGYYEDFDIWTDSAKIFEGKLKKGETVYYEIVGQLPNGQHIMQGQSNDKLKPFMEKKEFESFKKRYGDHTYFTYGTRPNKYEVYVYRITMTNEDGDDIDYTWEQVKQRCERLAVKHVPEYMSRIVEDGWREEDIEFSLIEMRDIPSQIFPEHIKEGICVRIDNGSMNPIILKDKTIRFKILENIIKDNGKVDIEEAN
jgi:hypothetical protein